MKRLFPALLLLALPALAQNPTGKVFAGSKSWTFDLPAGANVTDLKCDKTSLLIGETSTCVVTVNPVAPAGGAPVAPYGGDAMFSLSPPPPTNLIVPAGSFTVAFTVTRTQ